MHPRFLDPNDPARTNNIAAPRCLFAVAVIPQRSSPNNPPTILIQVIKGEPKGNNLVDKFKLTGIPPAPCGALEIKIAFGIDVNGNVNVSLCTATENNHPRWRGEGGRSTYSRGAGRVGEGIKQWE